MIYAWWECPRPGSPRQGFSRWVCSRPRLPPPFNGILTKQMGVRIPGMNDARNRSTRVPRWSTVLADEAASILAKSRHALRHAPARSHSRMLIVSHALLSRVASRSRSCSTTPRTVAPAR